MKKIIKDKSLKKKLKILLNKEISHLGKSSQIISKILEKYLTDKKSLKKMEYFIKPKPILSNKNSNIFNFSFFKIRIFYKTYPHSPNILYLLANSENNIKRN